jgi:hypothetical protein
MASLVRPCFLANRLTGTGSLPLIAAKRFQQTFVAGQPDGPEVVTAIPGPISKERYADLNSIQVS